MTAFEGLRAGPSLAFSVLAALLWCGLGCGQEPASPEGAMTGDASGAGGDGSSAGSGDVSGGGGTGTVVPPSGGASAAGAAGVAGAAGQAAGGSGGSAGTSPTADAGQGAGGSDAGGGGSAGSDAATRAIAAPPSYLGNGNGGCTMERQTTGFEPDDDAGAKHPLFLYFVGTRFVESDTSARFESEAAKKVTEAMARRGFVALSADYDNSLSFALDKVSCVFASSNPMSLLQQACTRPNVDCELGIATWGHSQGALMAHAASDHDTRIRAVWTTGYSGGDYPLPDSRLRVVNGEADTMNGTWSTLNSAAGTSAAECPDDGRSSCLRADGSGWIVVRASDCVTSSADHCWFDRTSCVASEIALEPNWIDPASTEEFALEANADWVAETAARP